MADLSPAAQAVMVAATMGNENCQADPVYRQCIAAALRVVADEVVPKLGRPRTADERKLYTEGRLDAAIIHRADILSIAAELDGRADG